jgi:CubicO group peptidase (beta-lactamase class C family)
MRTQRMILAFLFVGLGSLAVSAAPEAQKRAAVSVATPAQSNVALKRVQATQPQLNIAKAHKFGMAAGAVAVRDEQVDGVSLIAVSKDRLKPKAVKPKLNVGKFGETVHAALKDKVRGYALSLRQNDQNVLTLIWDWARTPQQGGQGWNLDTRMHVASVSKLMTAIVATKMLHDGNKSIDTKIGPYLPDYWNQPTSAANLTFRQLLTHQAGFTIYDGDFLSFKQQIEQGVVEPDSPSALDYTNGSFSLVRVLTATFTNAIDADTVYEFPLNVPNKEQYNDALWDFNATSAFLAYAQSKVFTPSGVSAVSAKPGNVGAYGYSGKSDNAGWNSGDVAGQLGGAGFRMSINDLLNVMGTFRRKGTIVPAAKANQAIEALLGLDQVIDTAAGKLYNKNGRWQTGSSASADTEQSVVYFLPENMELAVFVNSWVGAEQASLRGTIKNAYIANLQ